MADKYSSSASLMSAKDSSNQEHIISNATVKQALSEPFEIKALLVSSGFDMQDQLGQFLTINRYFNESGSNTLNRSYNGIVTFSRAFSATRPCLRIGQAIKNDDFYALAMTLLSCHDQHPFAGLSLQEAAELLPTPATLIYQRDIRF